MLPNLNVTTSLAVVVKTVRTDQVLVVIRPQKLPAPPSALSLRIRCRITHGLVFAHSALLRQSSACSRPTLPVLWLYGKFSLARLKMDPRQTAASSQQSGVWSQFLVHVNRTSRSVVWYLCLASDSANPRSLSSWTWWHVRHRKIIEMRPLQSSRPPSASSYTLFAIPILASWITLAYFLSDNLS